ncbi:MAG TPA: sulfotransferase [Acidisarcina sp.]
MDVTCLPKRHTRLPNFFIAGAPKAGTDLLYYQLDRHPQVFMSPLKEPNYFAEEIRIERFDPSLQPRIKTSHAELRAYLDAGAPGKRFGGIVTGLEDYCGLFASAHGERAIGEGSVCYLWSRTAAAGIASLIPHARVIIVLMDPAERAYQQYLKSLSDGSVTHSFSTHLDLAFDDLLKPQSQIRLFNPFLAFGEYAEQVDRYLKRFPPEQLFLSFYEDTQRDYHQWFAQLLTFLEVDCSVPPEEVDVPSTPHLPPGTAERRRVPEDRARLVAYYERDILRLQSLIGRDLSSWLD